MRTSSVLIGPLPCPEGRRCGPTAIVQRVVAQLPHGLAWPGGAEGPHVLEISSREPAHARELTSQVVGQTFQRATTPASGCLSRANDRSQAPVEADEFSVDGPS